MCIHIQTDTTYQLYFKALGYSIVIYKNRQSSVHENKPTYSTRVRMYSEMQPFQGKIVHQLKEYNL